MQLVKSHKTPNIQNSYKERRKFTRFTPKDGTMAVNNHALGPVVDISMGGLSFRYMDDKTDSLITNLFGIFLGSDDILIDKIQSKVIFSRVLAQGVSFLQTRSHQLSIEFINLSSSQRKKLEDFILTKTQGVA